MFFSDNKFSLHTFWTSYFFNITHSNIPLQSITILLCLLIRNTCPFNTWYFAKYYYITFFVQIHVFSWFCLTLFGDINCNNWQVLTKCPKRLDSFVEATLKSLTILAAGHAEPRLVVWQGCALLYQFNQNNRYYLSEKQKSQSDTTTRNNLFIIYC